jgi:hypothetical protein
MRLSAFGHTLLFAALVSIPLAAGRGQTRSGVDRWDTLTTARVILVPADDRSSIAWATSSAIAKHKVLAVYTTTGPVARGLATEVQARVGGPIFSLDRAGMSVDDFARLMVDTLIEKTARPNMKRAILVVAELELIHAFIRGTFSGRRLPSFGGDGTGLGTYIVYVSADNTLALSLRPWTLDR